MSKKQYYIRRLCQIIEQVIWDAFHALNSRKKLKKTKSSQKSNWDWLRNSITFRKSTTSRESALIGSFFWQRRWCHYYWEIPWNFLGQSAGEATRLHLGLWQRTLRRGLCWSPCSGGSKNLFGNDRNESSSWLDPVRGVWDALNRRYKSRSHKIQLALSRNHPESGPTSWFIFSSFEKDLIYNLPKCLL